MQLTSMQMHHAGASDEELVSVLTGKYGVREDEARSLDPSQLRIRIAALDFLANNLPASARPI